MARTRRSSSGVRWLLVGGLVAVQAASGQSVTAAATSSSYMTVVDVLHEFSDQAAVIFFGQVLSIQRLDSGVVEVQFRVDQAIRGCSVGTPYFLREWAGLWAGGNQRYRVGQRLLMLLHEPGAAGMSSPVGGLDGAIPIRQESTAAQQPYVDLRWLGARVPRPVVYSASSTKIGHLSAETQVAPSGVGSAPILDFTVGKEKSSVPSQQASMDAVMGMLMGWERAQHGAP